MPFLFFTVREKKRNYLYQNSVVSDFSQNDSSKESRDELIVNILLNVETIFPATIIDRLYISSVIYITVNAVFILHCAREET